jgi:hypothetical protein
MDKHAVTPGTFLTRFRAWQEESVRVIPVEGQPDYVVVTPEISTIAAMAEYESWLADPNTLAIRYEDLIASDVVMKQIADYLGVPYIDGAFEELPGYTITWNEEHSDYNTIWTPQVQQAWAAEGGNELLSRWGYQ